MDFLQKYEKKYLPNFHATRYAKRVQDALGLREKALKSPQNLSWEELRTIMRVLKHKKILPVDKKANQLEKQFLTNAIGGVIPSLAVGFMPYLLKEFHKKIKRKWLRLNVVGVISLAVYASIVWKPLGELNQYSRKQAQIYIEQLRDLGS